MTKRVFQFQANSNQLFVGLDVSSRCTGIAVVDARGRAIASHACETHKCPDVITVGQRIRSDVEDLFSRVEMKRNEESISSSSSSSSSFQWHAGVEACAKNFTHGRFNAKGLVKLAQINGIAQYICAERIKKIPLIVNPSTARSYYDVRNTPSTPTRLEKRRRISVVESERTEGGAEDGAEDGAADGADGADDGEEEEGSLENVREEVDFVPIDL
jgi:hypothetical protein